MAEDDSKRDQKKRFEEPPLGSGEPSNWNWLEDPEILASWQEHEQHMEVRVSQELAADAATIDEVLEWLERDTSCLHDAVSYSLRYSPAGMKALHSGKHMDVGGIVTEYRQRMRSALAAIAYGRLRATKDGLVAPFEFCEWAISHDYELPGLLVALVHDACPPAQPVNRAFVGLRHWKELRLSYKDSHYVNVTFASSPYPLHFKEAGMGREKPSKPWLLLVELVEAGGRKKWSQRGTMGVPLDKQKAARNQREALRKCKDRLASDLRKYFGLNSSPFRLEDGYLICNFRVKSD
ncbi:MAG: hypothetical protein IT364_27890 [Candidatus Hydrogenedentes bacterium]|nr:hypothetical protein [Candidatus Hydrogenedentota bacterium]